jgi:hypothetical protein
MDNDMETVGIPRMKPVLEALRKLGATRQEYILVDDPIYPQPMDKPTQDVVLTLLDQWLAPIGIPKVGEEK